MKFQVKVIAVLLMALAGLAQAQEQVLTVVGGMVTSQKRMPEIMARLGDKVGMTLGAYGDLEPPNIDEENPLDVRRLSWSIGFSVAPARLFNLYVAVDKFNQKYHDQSGRREDLDTEDWGAQFGGILNYKKVSGHVAWSTASKHAIIGFGFNL